MRKALVFVMVLHLLTIKVTAQVNARNTTATAAMPPGLKSHITPYPEFIPDDLDSLVEYSALVVQGIVSMQLPTRCVPPDCAFFYTDFEFTVKKLLKDDGTKRKFDKLIVSQDGGKLGDSEMTVVGDTLMREGEEYILCLAFDRREGRLLYDGARWVVRGIWQGKFRIKDQKVAVEETSVFKKTLNGSFNPRSVEDISVTDFVSQLERIVAKAK